MALTAISGYAHIPPGVAATTTIPMSLTDPRFASNVAGVAGQSYVSGTVANTFWNGNPTYASGNQCLIWQGLVSTDILTLSQCNVDWREGPRIGCNDGTMNVDQCFINCIGFASDHADGIQAFSSGGRGILNVTNTCFRSYTSTEAVNVYGAGALGSDALFWADSFQGTVNFRNVLVWGGDRGVNIFADVGTTHVSFENVYFVPSPDGWTGAKADIRATGGTLVVDKWLNVFDATIVGGVIVPGAAIPSP